MEADRVGPFTGQGARAFGLGRCPVFVWDCPQGPEGFVMSTHARSTGGHYVYLYRSVSGVPKYVGYGRAVGRALSHQAASHNRKLAAWLKKGDHRLEVVGPYGSEAEGKRVEAALISALRPEFNKTGGDGPKFVPVGVPPELSERPVMPALSLSEVGRMCGGALFVYLAPGDTLNDGRVKYDAALPDDAVVLSNMKGYWDIKRHSRSWGLNSGPKVLIGVHGPSPTSRFIVGAARIDRRRWFDESLRAAHDAGRWEVPLLRNPNLDVLKLRGRRLASVKFSNFSWALHIWVDGQGRKQHPR